MRVLYASRALGVHDRRLIVALSAAPPDGPGWTVQSVALTRSSPIAMTPDSPAFQEAVDRLARVASSFDPDVTVAGPLLDVGLAAVRAGIRPLLGLSWAFDLLLEAEEPGRDVLAREVLAHADLVACDSRAVTEAAIRYGAGPASIVCFPWGVDITRFQPGGSRALREQLGWNEAFVVLSARAHEPVYAMSVLIEAFRMAVASRPEMRLLVLGEGSLRAELEAETISAGLAQLTHFAGRIDQANLPACYSAADCYVSASRVDGSSISLLEAMAAGLPAIATAVGGNPEWISPGATGWLVPVDDPLALGEALAAAASLSTEGRQAMSAAARLVAMRRADWRHNAVVFTQAVARAASVGRLA